MRCIHGLDACESCRLRAARDAAEQRQTNVALLISSLAVDESQFPAPLLLEEYRAVRAAAEAACAAWATHLSRESSANEMASREAEDVANQCHQETQGEIDSMRGRF